MKNLKIARLGLTLVEVLIVTIIIGILSIGVANLYVTSAETTMMVQQRSEATFSAQEGVERMVDMVRNSDGVLEFAADSFVINDRGVRLEFEYDPTGDKLLKDGSAYASGITSFSSTYYDAAGGVTVTPVSIVKIVFAITATNKDEEQSLDTSVIIRRLT